MILVSACLLGVNCKYNGGNNRSEKLKQIIEKYGYVPVCPEQLGGMPTPRKPNEIIGGSGADVLQGTAAVKDKQGNDNSESFIKGAEESLKIAQMFNVKYAILKERSPSCGRNRIYDGSFSGELKKGMGVTAELLEKNGIKVYSEEQIEQFVKDMEKELLGESK